MRIAALLPERILPSIYRSLVPMQALAHRGHTVHVEERNALRNPSALLGFDLVHILRFSNEEMRRMARRLREAGVAVVWDLDDDLASIPMGHPVQKRFGDMMFKRALAELGIMMRTAHVVTTPTEALAERFRERGASDVRVLGNYLPPTFQRPARVMPHTGVVIGWLGSYEHTYDVEQLGLRELLERLLQRHQHLEVVSIGVDIGLRSRRYRNSPLGMYGDLAPYMARWDIGIAPLADVPYNQAFSDVKVKEYAAMGVSWLASPVGGYRGLGEDQGGRLVPDDGWYEELEDLIDDADTRSRLGRRGRQWAQGETIEQHVDQWERAFEAAVAHARAPAVR